MVLKIELTVTRQKTIKGTRKKNKTKKKRFLKIFLEGRRGPLSVTSYLEVSFESLTPFVLVGFSPLKWTVTSLKKNYLTKKRQRSKSLVVRSSFL